MSAPVREALAAALLLAAASPTAAQTAPPPSAPPPPPSQGERTLTGAEITATVAGSTLVGARDGDIQVEHYAWDGTLQGLFRGERYAGVWSVADGRLCTHVAGAGPDCRGVSADGAGLRRAPSAGGGPVLLSRFSGDAFSAEFNRPPDTPLPLAHADTPEGMELARRVAEIAVGPIVQTVRDGVVLDGTWFRTYVRVADPAALKAFTIGQLVAATGRMDGAVFHADTLRSYRWGTPIK